jgi:hypothetical protein
MLIIPPSIEAEAMLEEAQALNPGPWAAHSRVVAQAARSIALQHPEIEAETAYVLGLLHDIGRRAGVTGMRHAVDGYNYLLALGYPDAARICLTHSYPTRNAAEGSGGWDGSDEEYRFVQAFLDRSEYSPYDRLIQVCDALSMPGGCCLMEKRLVDVARRYGCNEYTLPKWEAFFEIKAELERVIGSSVYDLLPDVVENTFKPWNKPMSGEYR